MEIKTDLLCNRSTADHRCTNTHLTVTRNIKQDCSVCQEATVNHPGKKQRFFLFYKITKCLTLDFTLGSVREQRRGVGKVPQTTVSG